MAVLRNKRGHNRGALPDTVPVVFANPIVEGTARNLEHLGDLGYAEARLKVEAFGGGLLFGIHKIKVNPCPLKGVLSFGFKSGARCLTAKTLRR